MSPSNFYQGPGHGAVSLHFGSAHQLNDLTDKQDIALPNSTLGYTPYLGLRARLSQTWINRWTILLLLVLVRVLLAIKGLNGDIASAKTEALSACTSVEAMGSAMASMPYYMSLGVNELAANGVTKAVNGLMEMLQLTVTGVEEIVLFVINMMTATYTCLITLAIDSSLEAAIQVIENVGNFMNKTIAGITSGISKDIASFEGDINKLISDLNSIPEAFGSSATIPTLNINASLADLNSIHIDPTSMDADLTKLNASLPTFAQVQNFTNTVISLPFEEVKKLIKESMVAYKFDSSIFPVAQRQTLTFCSDNNGIDSFFTGLTRVADDARKAFIVVMIILAILACIPMAYLEIRRWRTMQQRASLVDKKAWDKMDVVYIASRPYTAGAGIKVASKFSGTKRQNAIRWFVAYCTTLPALFLLGVGVAGLLACLCQAILLHMVEKEVPVLANEVGDFAGMVVSALQNASEQWAHEANAVILDTNNKINSDIFGWVNTSTHAINATLNGFVTEMTSALNETFGGTILYKPILGIFDCLIGLKIASFEKGLTWVSDNAKVDFPEFRNDTFSLGAAASLSNDSSVTSFLASPSSTTTDDLTATVATVGHVIADGIRTEAIISAVIVCLYLVIVLVGGLRALYMIFSHDKTRGEGGARPAPLSPRFNKYHETRTQQRNNASAAATRFPRFDGGGLRSATSASASASDEKSAYDDGDGGYWNDADAVVPPYDAKYGQASVRNVGENIRPAHAHKSSYGDIKR